MDPSQIGKRAWSYAGVLQDAGLSCFEYVEQLTLLLFLKMADQLTEPPYGREPIVPRALGWKALLPLDGAPLEEKYREILEKLALKPGMLGVIFKSARCEIHNPALLKQLIVNLIDKVDWLELPVDVKGTIYEELLQRSAQESSRGAGQYFTPRPVIQAICEVMQPMPADRICDPAAGTGGFLCNAYNYVLERFEKDLDRDEKRALREELVEGMELSPKVGRMCAMNLYLHGIGGNQVAINAGHDSLAASWSKEYSMVLTNPPFGKKQSLLFVNEEGDTEKEDQVVLREDFWTSTSNKQLNFVQHIYTLLKIDGRAVDFLGYGSADGVTGAIQDVCSVKADDGIVFDLIRITSEEIREDAEYDGLRVRVPASLDGAKAPLQIDIGFGDAVDPVPQEMAFPAMLEMESPRIKAYPPEVVIAEKLQAMVHLGIANSRMKDFFDIWVLSRQQTFVMSRMRRAVETTFARRNTALPSQRPTALTGAFLKDKGKIDQWKAFLHRMDLPKNLAELGEVGDSIAGFLMPVIQAVRVNLGDEQEWPARGPWQKVSAAKSVKPEKK